MLSKKNLQLSNDIDTLLNIMDMGGKHGCYSEERNWLLRVLYAVPLKSAVKPLADKWIAIIKEHWASESEYFTTRNDVRTDAKKLVDVLAAERVSKMKARQEHLNKELAIINKELGRFTKWS
jgi:hypothetical protein